MVTHTPRACPSFTDHATVTDPLPSSTTFGGFGTSEDATVVASAGTSNEACPAARSATRRTRSVTPCHHASTVSPAALLARSGGSAIPAPAGCACTAPNAAALAARVRVWTTPERSTQVTVTAPDPSTTMSAKLP